MYGGVFPSGSVVAGHGACATCAAPRLCCPTLRDARRCIGSDVSWKCRTTGGCAVVSGGVLAVSAGGLLGDAVAQPGESALDLCHVRSSGALGGIGLADCGRTLHASGVMRRLVWAGIGSRSARSPCWHEPRYMQLRTPTEVIKCFGWLRPWKTTFRCM